MSQFENFQEEIKKTVDSTTKMFEHFNKHWKDTVAKTAEDWDKVMKSDEMKHFTEMMSSSSDKLEEEIEKLYSKSKSKFQEFVKNMDAQFSEARSAFDILVEVAFDDKKITDEEKKAVGDALKDSLKTVGFIGLVILPGGTLFLILVHFLKLSNYVLPSAFQKEKTSATK